MKFVGYRRPDGRVGTRNYVGVLSTVVCANEVARGIAGQVKGAVAFNHQQGCCQTSPDLMRVTQTLCGLGQNPNLAAVILVSLGCEGTDVAQVARSVAESGKPGEVVAVRKKGMPPRARQRVYWWPRRWRLRLLESSAWNAPSAT